MKNIIFYIAVANSIFKITNAAVFLPFIGALEKACEWLVPRKKGMLEIGPQYLEKHLLETPPIAMEQARKETVRMIEMSSRSVSDAVRSFQEHDLNLLKQVPKLEQAVDNLQSSITQYLVELSQKDLSREVSEELPVMTITPAGTTWPSPGYRI